jgi:hypothetical protein
VQKSLLRLAASLTLGFALIASPAALRAQSTFGTLVGTVKDKSGAVIPEAVVVATETATSISHTVVTDSAGNYEIPNLLPGNYRVSVKKEGFEEYVRGSIPLDARVIVRVDAELQVGTTHVLMEVKATPPVITTETGTVSATVDHSALDELPVNYRAVDTSPLNIVSTIPGIQMDPSGLGGISISGSHPQQNEISVDGFSVHEGNNSFQTEMFPSSEAIAQAQVTEEVAPAQYSQMGDISLITRGGTNQFHGSLFEYLQNDDLDAIPGFANGKPKLDANDFGGAIGGPVIIPHLYNGKDRTFFFFDFEGNRQRSTSALAQNVPTPDMLAGNFSALCSSYNSSGICTSAKGAQLVDPLTGQLFPNNQIPSGQFNSVSEKVLSLFYPAPNFQSANPLDTTNNFIEDFPSPTSTNMWDVRIDQRISSKQSVFGRFSWKHITSLAPNGLLVGPTDNFLSPPALGVSYTYSLTTNLLNEFRFGYNHSNGTATYANFSNGAQVISQLGLQQLGTQFPAPPSAIPYFEFDGASGISNNAGGRGGYTLLHNYQFNDDLTWIRGRHTLKMGADIREYRKQEVLSFTNADNYGNFYFTGALTGYDFADFLLGLPTYTAISDVTNNLDGTAMAYAFYAQDSFRVSSKLTFNYGLRYEYYPPFTDKYFNIANFDRTTGAVIVPNTAALDTQVDPTFAESVNACGLPTPVPTAYGLYPCTPIITAAQEHIPQSLRKPDRTDFNPRASFAYRLSDKTVIRAGGGMYTQGVVGSIEYSLTGITSTDYRVFTNAITATGPAIQFPNTRTSGSGILPVLAGNAAFGTANQIDYHDPYEEQWTFGVERDLGHGTGLRVTYTGLRSVGLSISPDLNQIQPQSTAYSPTEKPFPNWGVIKTRDNGGSAIYNGLETVVTHRFGAGLFFQSSWVWSKNLSDADGDTTTAFPGEAGPRIVNRFDIHADYGDVSATRQHRWLSTLVWQIPIGRGQHFGSTMNRALNGVVGGWSTSNILLIQTGPWLTPYYPGGGDPSGTNAPSRIGTQRPDREPASACNGLTAAEGQVLDGSCFYYGWPGAIGRFGNSGVGIVEGPGTVNWNFGLSKNFPLGERTKLRFQATSTNFMNHVNLGLPTMAANSSSFGAYSSVQNIEGTGARNIQFALRLEF